MIVPVVVGGRLRRLSVERLDSESRFRVTCDGRTLEVSGVRTGTGAWSLLFPDGSQYRVAVSGSTTSGLTVHLPSGDLAAEVVTHLPRGRSQPAGEGGASGPAQVRAPMPGRVVRVLAPVGQPVQAGQGVIVVEAMKMENELRAPRDGVVTEVRAALGASVEAGAVLVVID